MQMGQGRGALLNKGLKQDQTMAALPCYLPVSPEAAFKCFPRFIVSQSSDKPCLIPS